MAIEVFNRYETKFIITDETYRLLKPQLNEYMEVDEHSRNGEFYTICNIYYDTPDHAIIRKSIEKPFYKEKLRLRSYGVVGYQDKVYLEIKKKCDGCVNKRRTSLTLEDAYHYLETKEMPSANDYLSHQILNEIDYMVQRYSDLRPALYLSYDRSAMFGIEDRNFRITFDTNIRSRRENVGLEKGNYGELLLPENQWVMEVKVKDTVPLWFAKLLSEYQIYPASFSKYGTEYQRTALHRKTNPEKTKLYA